VGAEAVQSATFRFEHPEELAPVVGFLAAHARRHGAAASPSYALVGVNEHDRIELPGAVHEALTKVVAALHAGKAVTIAPQTMTLTTQQAADLLGVSRPTVVRLVNDNVSMTTFYLPNESATDIDSCSTTCCRIGKSAASTNTTHWQRPLTSTAMTIRKRSESNYATHVALWRRTETKLRSEADTMGCDVRCSVGHLGAMAKPATRLSAFARNRGAIPTSVAKRNSGRTRIPRDAEADRPRRTT
jgi:predicted DNA-binding protein (UPF0251 family)